ncbi:MAG: hypothetical protein KIT56_03530 [Gammaproteobacteria bacterium]|nr:hypothetical protein [Gammaproteobacteria bacterium]MCW5582949.1 hypothetical protein [Gammaproteobacteria bacterium]
MELKEFIRQVLSDVVEAVEQTRAALGNENGRSICPVIGPAFATKFGLDFDPVEGRYLQKMEFDVAVTAENTAGIDGKASVKVFGLGLGTDADLKQTNSTVSRIKFHVPIALRCKKEQ